MGPNVGIVVASTCIFPSVGHATDRVRGICTILKRSAGGSEIESQDGRLLRIEALQMRSCT